MPVAFDLSSPNVTYEEREHAKRANIENIPLREWFKTFTEGADESVEELKCKEYKALREDRKLLIDWFSNSLNPMKIAKDGSVQLMIYRHHFQRILMEKRKQCEEDFDLKDIQRLCEQVKMNERKHCINFQKFLQLLQ